MVLFVCFNSIIAYALYMANLLFTIRSTCIALKALLRLV